MNYQEICLNIRILLTKSGELASLDDVIKAGEKAIVFLYRGKETLDNLRL